jgi:hypothetical protein
VNECAIFITIGNLVMLLSSLFYEGFWKLAGLLGTEQDLTETQQAILRFATAAV